MSRTAVKATAAEVRAWASGKGLAIAGARGRLSKEAITQFNKSHTKSKYEGAAK